MHVPAVVCSPSEQVGLHLSMPLFMRRYLWRLCANAQISAFRPQVWGFTDSISRLELLVSRLRPGAAAGEVWFLRGKHPPQWRVEEAGTVVLRRE